MCSPGVRVGIRQVYGYSTIFPCPRARGHGSGWGVFGSCPEVLGTSYPQGFCGNVALDAPTETW